MDEKYNINTSSERKKAFSSEELACLFLSGHRYFKQYHSYSFIFDVELLGRGRNFLI
jgi:hypothetical protein